MGKGQTTTTSMPDPQLSAYRDRYLKAASGYAAGQPLRFYGSPGYQYNLPQSVFEDPRGKNPLESSSQAWQDANGQPVPAGTPGAQPAAGGGSSGGGGWGAPPTYGPGQDPWVAAGGDPTANIDKFMNPYEKDVIGGIQSDFDRQRGLLTNNVSDLATKARAFGGSRAAVLQSRGLRDIGQNETNATAGFRYSGFNNALQDSIAERGYQRDIRQEEIDAGRSRFDQAQNYGKTQLDWFRQGLSGVPAGQNSSVQKDPWQQFLDNINNTVKTFKPKGP